MGQILGIDVGTKTLGLAVSDAGQTVALPLRTLARRSFRADLAALGEVLGEREIREVVVGLPLNLDGSPGAMSEACEKLAAALEARFGVQVHRWDERMSTVSAERALLEADVSRRKRRKVIDKLAATLILQGFLDRRGIGRSR
ncbi:MAG TPA: Holliday junction resolvase RuvX [Acidobacteria bacterium]|nr:Holliday junction resolvase RuvX [Acidobacteriota bacterium]